MTETHTGRRIRPEALSRDAWEPFGWLPLPDTDPRDGEDRLHFDWGDPHVNVIGHDLSELSVGGGTLRCEAMFRHDTHTQTLMSLDHPAVIVVAPAGCPLRSDDDLGAVRAFALEPLEPLVLHRGTWHWGPYPVVTPAVSLFNVQGLRYAEDNQMVDLAGRGLSLDVVVARVGPAAGR